MSDKSGIQWTDATWNPTSGCDRVSPGCDHCYAMTLAKRLKAMGSPRYQVDGDPRTSGPGFGVQTHAVALDQPLRWTKPRRIFVNSMSDLFHDQVSDEFISRVFDVMEQAPRHTFQILTKRHARMRSFMRARQRDRVDYARQFDDCPTEAMRNSPAAQWARQRATTPPAHIWLGVSVEDQKWADIRIPALLDTPTAVRFLSLEPLLGPVDLRAWTTWSDGSARYTEPDAGVAGLDWAIVGGESGPGARPMDPEWVRSLVGQCIGAEVIPFVKQLGACWAREHGGDSHGGDWSLWPEDLRVREFPVHIPAAA
jgi:protein gp37